MTELRTREQLLALFPDDAAMRDATPATLKPRSIAVLRAILTAFRTEGKEPDNWERVDLADAIGALHTGLVRYALACADHCLTPDDQRSPQPVSVRPEIAVIPLTSFFDAVDYVESVPLGPFARFH